jgi:AcrR family transcriptional regulator
LLAAAERSFAERGFAAASVREVTTAAHCNLAAVNYYFGGKQGLYEALFRSRLADLRRGRVESVERALARAGSAATLELLLRAFANAFLEPLVAEGRGRHLIALISRETLDPQLPPRLFRSEVVEPVQSALSDALMRLIPQLERREAQLCVLSIIGQLVQVAHRCRWAAVTDVSRGLRPRLNLMIEHIVRFSAAAVRAYAKGRR